jgi:hypothetical protein
MSSKWSIKAFLEKGTFSQISAGCSRNGQCNYTHLTDTSMKSNAMKSSSSKKMAHNTKGNLSCKQSVFAHATKLNLHPCRTVSNLASANNCNNGKQSLQQIAVDNGDSYIQLLKDKNKIIESLLNENNKLIEQNKKLIEEKSESKKIIQEFAHSMGNIIQSLYTNRAPQSNASGNPKKDNTSVATSSTDVPQRAIKNIYKTPMKGPHTNRMSSNRKSVSELLLESSHTVEMVQSALHEIQDLVD